MIHIEQGQQVTDNENLIVATATGDYADDALIEFYDVSNPEVIAGSFHAQYVKYGNMVYRFNSNKELGDAILVTDPESTHGAASYVRMIKDLDSQMADGSLEPKSLDQVITNEQIKIEDQMTNPQDLPVESDPPVEPDPQPEIINEPEPDPSTDTVPESPEVPAPDTEPTDPIPPTDNVTPDVPVQPDTQVAPPVETTPPADQPVSFLTNKRIRKIV